MTWQPSDEWRGHERPYYAVAGVSDTGMWSDSPCPSDTGQKELADLKAFLKRHNITTKSMTSPSSNLFMVKQWLIVQGPKFAEAKKLVQQYLATHETHLLHD